MTRRRIGYAVVLAVVLLECGFSAFWWGQRDVARSASFAYFERHVAPILARSCSARDAEGAFVCHGRPGRSTLQAERGVSTGLQHVFPTRMADSCTKCHARQEGSMRFLFGVGADGGLDTERRVVLAYERARELARYDGPSRVARLLRMPLSAQAGGFGLIHGGGEIYDSALDPEFGVLSHWVELENREVKARAGGPGAAEAAFRDDVLPVLARNTCFAASCHAFNHSSFLPDPGMPNADLATPIPERFTPEQVAFNRLTTLGLVQNLAYLTGDVEQSRILRKAIPMASGGVLHRGGNDGFLTGPGDPDYLAVAGWLRLERREAIARLHVAGTPVPEGDVGRVRGVVFVRTPTANHRHYLDVGRYLPGGDLFLLRLKDGETLETASSRPVNLTARFHPGVQADVREPDVRYDGRAILFAMRIGEGDGLNLYRLDLDDDLEVVEGSLRRLTFGPARVNGIPIHFTDPTWVPDPLDANAAAGGTDLSRADIVFASNLAGTLLPSFERGTLGEADGGDRSSLVDYDRPERDGAFVGRRLYVVDGANRGEWRTITAFENRLFTEERRSTIRVDRPFPEPVDDSTIYVIEREEGRQPGFLPSYAVYGMKQAPSGAERSIYEQTLTRITWTLGQDLDLSVRSTGEVFYASQRSACDKDGRPIFNVASCRRHLDTRFSFPTHHGNRSEVLIYADNNELPTGIDVHVGLDPDNLWEAGALYVSDHQFGPDVEARNPNDRSTGLFDRDGALRASGVDATNTRARFDRPPPAHPRFVPKNSPLFPLDGPGAVTRTGLSPGGAYRDPTALPDGRLLASYAAGPLDHLDPDARPDFDLVLLEGEPGFQPPGGHGTPRVRAVRLAAASEPGFSELEAQPVMVRIKPKINAGRRPVSEHLIRYPGTPIDRRPARYLERNFLLIDAILADPSPVGKHVAYDRDPVTGHPVPPLERVRYVRMVEAVPMDPASAAALDVTRVRNGDPQSTRVSNGIHPAKRLVAEAPLEPDGSVSFRLPSNTPLLIQSLNADRMALRQEARVYFFVPNEPFTISPAPSETFQTCAACMGAMSGRPERLFGPPTAFTGQGEVEAIARYGGEPPGLGLVREERPTIDFARDLQPVLDRHCAACHGGARPAAGLTLSGEATTYYSASYESLMQLEDPASGWFGRKRYVSERDGLAIESYLTEKLYGKELKAPRALSGDAPHPSPALFRAQGLVPAPLSDAQRLLFVRWMDFGATFRGPQDSAPAAPAPTAGPVPGQD